MMRPQRSRRRSATNIFGCTERVNHRLIVTNVTRLPRLIAKRRQFSAILVDELDNLPAAFFTSVKEYLATRRVVYPAAKQPFPFQQEIINQAVQHFQQNGHTRGRLIMACGTGKTLTALWITERLATREVLVLVPSLALMRQTLREWAANTSLPPLDCLCICSDETVAHPSGADPDPALQWLWEMVVPVRTRPHDLCEFLTRPSRGRMRVVLSTYQSGDVLEAGLSRVPGFKFDLAVCDEAHRTAGPQDRHFAKVLHDDAIPCGQRLFMTATPRLVAPHLQRRAATEDIVLCSMDDEATYGSVISCLTFGKAIERDIIADYKIALVGVRDPEVRQVLEENPPLGIAGPGERAIRAQHLAKQLAVLKGMAECGARKVFTFHGRIRAAKAFALASTPEGIQHILDRLPAYRDRLTGFRADHVNGTQSTADRAAILQETLCAPYGLVSNAGCLTEGVDVPGVDAVAFIDPRESLSAIVQATGRALRKAEGKLCGYILIPVFLGDTDDPDQIAESSEFKIVYRVVRAMADQDERLEERLRLARREMALGGSRAADSGPIVTIGIKTSYRVKAGVFFKPKPQAQQEVEREEHVEHVPVPRRPGPVLVLVHADLALPVLEALLDRPAQG
ncbi:MAG: DEAD/DEAH box helicase family protein, partial [candidate division NC10 bacterium]|nr:DEAD/DEAH box helicase family protein [candidate division NC10 bacterium]